jgi:hypothetical protein
LLPASFVVFFLFPVSSLYDSTENELQGPGLAISKNASRVLKVTDFEIIVCPPTSTLKLKVLMLKFYFFCNEIQHHKLKFCVMSFEAFNLLIQESYDVKCSRTRFIGQNTPILPKKAF